MTATTSSVDPATGPDPAPAPESDRTTLRQILADYGARLRGGDVGPLPALLGLVVLVAVFSALRPGTFTSAYNFANLIGQSAGVTVLAMGLVFVLLLGDIDLAAGYTGGTAAAVLGVALTQHDWPLVPALVVGILTGTVIGAFLGSLRAFLGIPSFVVTLAAFLGLQGVLLALIGDGGTIPYQNSFVNSLNNDNLPVWLGWLLAVVGVVGYAVSTYAVNHRRRAKRLTAEPMLLWAIKTGVVAVVTVAVVYYLSVERSRNPALTSLKGVPISLLMIVVLLAVLSFALGKTAWGRHVYAVGGNAEAARRAGINVALIRLTCFVVNGTVAAIAGLLIASRTNSVNPDTGGSDTLLYAVGAAVIGGASLFGGKGRVLHALIGGTVVAVIQNGMALLNQPQSTVWIVTGVVLLIAASVDAISRRRSAARGAA